MISQLSSSSWIRCCRCEYFLCCGWAGSLGTRKCGCRGAIEFSLYLQRGSFESSVGSTLCSYLIPSCCGASILR
ncbi:hypothetical protein OROMI_008192 [Orobanche minor]